MAAITTLLYHSLSVNRALQIIYDYFFPRRPAIFRLQGGQIEIGESDNTRRCFSKPFAFEQETADGIEAEGGIGDITIGDCNSEDTQKLDHRYVWAG
jgi:hypothetical protein